VTSEHIRVEHPRFARSFERVSGEMETRGVAEHRERLLAGLSGRVLEVGAGNGLNFRHYPKTVTEVVAVEPEPYLLDRARENAARAPVVVTVVDGVAEALPVESGTFDAAVASHVLCSVGDQQLALAELRRALRVGGELRFYEHVRSQHPRAAFGQRLLDRVWPRLAGGCHLCRDTVAAIVEAGFALEGVERFSFRPFPIPLPTAPHVLGTARLRLG
jgi:ubiquinone/menaquinone biosynthesis C-methylase UbiE